MAKSIKFRDTSVLVEAFEVHKELNPKIWDTNNKLLPDVRDKILEIVDEFEANVKDMTGMDITPVDIHLLGSNASYNYTSKSDLDVHLVVNFEMIDTNEDLVQALFNLQKSEFNDSYDISIHGIDVELYVEDIKANTVSNGIYSVTNDMWIKEPQPITDVPEINIEDQIDEWKTKISDILSSNDVKRVSDAIDELYLIRKNGLATTGEYGDENQLFKEIRSLGLLDELKEKYMELRSKDLSLENYKRLKENKSMKDVMTFDSPEALYEALKNDDLYDLDNETYMFIYNDAGAYAYYSLDPESMVDLAKDAREDNEYLGAFLGPGGYIVDVEGYDDDSWLDMDYDEYIKPVLEELEGYVGDRFIYADAQSILDYFGE